MSVRDARLLSQFRVWGLEFRFQGARCQPGFRAYGLGFGV
jgi:hypothetical protein